MCYDDDSDARAHKTGRIAILSVMIAFLGVLLFAYKVDACADKPADHTCKEEFYEFKSDLRNEFTCKEGAVAETVTNPKAGILCHCPKNGQAPAPAGSK